jgi:2-oxoglutarate dehydrogenase E2 component (dihydrolipoamide succinyltransferase)
MSTELFLPPLPIGGSEARVVRWLKHSGDRLAPGDGLLVVANDRAEIALPAAHAGILDAVLVGAGASVEVGSPVARIVPGGAPSEARRHRISPVARRIAAAANVDPAALRGTGPGGWIMKSDILALLERRTTNDERPVAGHIQEGRPAERQADLEPRTTDHGPRTTDDTPAVQPSAMRRAIAEHMVRSRLTSPHALTAMEVDMGRVAAARARRRAEFARRGVDLTYTACIALAAVEALLRHPLLNSSWSDSGIVVRGRVHLGLAVALPHGLITPVIREAQDLNLRGIARAVADAARRARAGALRPGEASGGTFTITNPGAGALWFGTPIIPQPQCAILGVGAVRPRPLVVSEGGVDRVAVRPTTLLTLAYDARVLDQCRADDFLHDVKQRLEHFAI